MMIYSKVNILINSEYLISHISVNKGDRGIPFSSNVCIHVLYKIE